MRLTAEEQTKNAELPADPETEDIVAFWQGVSLKEAQPQWLADVASEPVPASRADCPTDQGWCSSCTE